MATQKVVIEGSSAVTAAQLKDLFRQVADGSLTGEHLQAFLEHKDPFAKLAEVSTSTKVEQRKLLESVASMPLEAVASFVAAKHFVIDTSEGAIVKIAWLGENFKKHFVPKTESNVPAIEAKISKLLEVSLDPAIITACGEETAEVSLAHLYALLKLQPKGKRGKLLTNGFANIFYVRDTSDVLWAVAADWSADCGGWHVYADPVSYPDRWCAGNQVVSR